MIPANVLDLVLLVCVLCVVVLLLSRIGKKRVRYIDAGRSQVFYSKRYKISAKPDLVENKNTLVEKKSRRKGVYPSDIAQLIAATLAVRSKYDIRDGYVVNQTERKQVDLTGSDSELFALIRTEYEYAVMIKKGKQPPPSPAQWKCRSCQFKGRCKYAVV